VFANLWYDLPMAPRVHPYLGGGIGGSRVDARVTGGAAGSGDFDTVFAWQGGAGIGFDVAPHVRLSADWRYIHTSSAKIEQPSLFVPAGGEANYMGNSAGLSLKFCFGRTPTYHAAAAPVHTSYAPPAPPPQPRDVTLRTVNFQFDSADLTPAAKQTLDDIARTLTQQPSLRLQVEGATDSIGSEQYNQQLSERRANAVRDYLVSKGVSPGQLTTIGVDANKPVASNETPEGRAENRRAEFAPMEAAPPDIRLEVRGPTPESTREAEQQAPGHPPDPGEKK
jgi:OOP family OmpA-OmpF porin